MIDTAFFNWLSDCYEEDSITLEEMDILLHDDKKAKALFQEFIDVNEDAGVEWMRWQIKDFLYENEKWRDG